MSVGIGFDVHRLKKGRRMVLGGVTIPFDKGPVGHSDGDALLHALIDALLGASGQGDIGEWFPNSDPKHEGADSGSMLARVLEDVGRKWSIVNADLNVIADQPRLGPAKKKIRENIARLLKVDPSRVNVKAKTMEGLGDIGRGRAVMAQAVVELKAK
jgi:2-C-methyl-D-erythritol 2,4-cyclodiphosphate synthase